MKTIALLLCCTLTLTACQPNLRVTYMPLVDTKRTDMNKFYDDLHECQDAAAPIEDNTVAEGLTMALIGAGVGAAIGSTYGSGFASHGAQTGAIAGAAIGTADGQHSWKSKTMDTIDACLRGRGHNLIGRS